MFWKNFVMLCNQKGKSPNGACAELGLSTNTATKWKQGSVPRDTTLRKIAEYFGVSVSYLLGAVDDPDPVSLVDPSKKEPPMLDAIEALLQDMTEEELADVRKYAEFLISKNKEE